MGFEEEIRDIFDEEFVRRAVKLKKTGNIFNPVFYILFTRLVEISSIINDVVLPNRLEIEEMFRTRKEFLQLDMKTINETLRRVWIFEIRRDEEYKFSKGIEDLMYIVYRMKDIQKKIDEVLMRHITKWEKEEILELYFILGKVLLEVEERIVDIASKEARVAWLRWLMDSMGLNSNIVNQVYEYLSRTKNPLAAIRLAETGDFGEIQELEELIRDLDENTRKILLNGMKVVFKEIE
ncbi:hypothetical protein GAH_01451 [Geoglobus ahangari]|uniref:Uncharacterized protein n=1 Tax=Geoglobus ahangari TaxID=113653 RepID=A0A0F7IH13_9EURY|nr:hypothetical protein [Geoglobus ahangari]AKG91257.1 hypothetical protein GAH_01451 [Geoglobus ahangari]